MVPHAHTIPRGNRIPLSQTINNHTSPSLSPVSHLCNPHNPPLPHPGNEPPILASPMRETRFGGKSLRRAIGVGLGWWRGGWGWVYFPKRIRKKKGWVEGDIDDFLVKCVQKREKERGCLGSRNYADQNIPLFPYLLGRVHRKNLVTFFQIHTCILTYIHTYVGR